MCKLGMDYLKALWYGIIKKNVYYISGTVCTSFGQHNMYPWFLVALEAHRHNMVQQGNMTVHCTYTSVWGEYRNGIKRIDQELWTYVWSHKVS